MSDTYLCDSRDCLALPPRHTVVDLLIVIPFLQLLTPEFFVPNILNVILPYFVGLTAAFGLSVTALLSITKA